MPSASRGIPTDMPILPGRRVYSFYKGFQSDNALDFSKRSSFDRDVMLERIYPSRIILPMLQHYGRECRPIVRPGQNVSIGQCVGVPDPGTFAVPVHSGISGTVKEIKPIILPDGRETSAVIIDGDGKRTYDKSVRPRNNVNISAPTVKGIIRDAGIVGLGGEGIPTIAKINLARRLKVRELLINCLQSEPYAAGDYYITGEYADYVIMGAVALAGACGVRVINILISKDRKYEIMALRSAMERSFSRYSGYAFNFVWLQQRFPQGYEPLVARALYGVSPASGESLESRCGAVMFNCATVYACWHAISESMPLVSRIISISTADGIRHNVKAPVGTPVSQILDSVNGTLRTSRKIIWGNCLTGTELHNPDETPIIKTTSGIGVIEEYDDSERCCISCGRCSDVCPVNLEPSILARLLSEGHTDSARSYGITECIACGACSFICPSHIRLSEITGRFSSLLGRTAENPYRRSARLRVYDDVSLLSADLPVNPEGSKNTDDSFTLPFEGGIKV